MKKRILLLGILTACLLAGQAMAAGAQALPPELEGVAPEAAELVTPDPAGGFGLLSGLGTLWERGTAALQGILFSGVRAVAGLMAGVVLLGVVESAAPAGKDTLGPYITAAGALWVTSAAAGDLNALIGLGRETIGEVSMLSKTLLPVLAAAEAAGGRVTAAAVRQTAAVFFADLLLDVIEGALLPMVYLYIGVSAAGAVLEGDFMDRAGALLKKAVGWVLGGLLTLYTGFLTLGGAAAGTADAQAVKLAKSAVSAAVPVVGGILSDAAETVLAGAGVLRGMLGVFGTLAVLACCLLPFLRLGCQYLLYQAAALVSAAVGPKKLTDLLARLGDAFGLVLAMTGTSALLLLISLFSSLMAVTA